MSRHGRRDSEQGSHWLRNALIGAAVAGGGTLVYESISRRRNRGRYRDYEPDYENDDDMVYDPGFYR